MSDIAVYGVVNLQVTDAGAYRQYEKGFFPSLSAMAASSSPLTMRPCIWKAQRRAQGA